MSDNVSQQERYLFHQNFAFSTKYLDYGIPNFYETIDNTIPVRFNRDNLEVIANTNVKRYSPNKQLAFLKGVIAKKQRLICINVVAFHLKLMEWFNDDKDAQNIVWELTDQCLIWDLFLLERRIVLATSGKVTSPPDTAYGLNQYHSLLRLQFKTLIDELPFLKNDIVGRRVFPEQESDSPYISAPQRVLARDQIHFKERLHLFVPLIEGWKKYGPACVGLDAQAAIAEYYQRQNTFSCPPNAKEACQNELKRLAKNSKLPRDENELKRKILKAWKKTTTHQLSSPPVELPERLKRRIELRDKAYLKRQMFCDIKRRKGCTISVCSPRSRTLFLKISTNNRHALHILKESLHKGRRGCSDIIRGSIAPTKYLRDRKFICSAKRKIPIVFLAKLQLQELYSKVVYALKN